MTTTETEEQDRTAAPTEALRFDQAAIEADATVPAIHVWRDFQATPAQLFRAHTDPEIFARWVGPRELETEVTEWDARDGGAWRYTARRDDLEDTFHGCFHTVREDRIVQTFTWDGLPDAVSLETMTFDDLGDGRTRLHAFSLCDSFEGRDQWLAGGMQVGIDEGYAELDRLIVQGGV